MSALSSVRELQPFVVSDVRVSGRVLGEGSYGFVEEAEIPGATCVVKKLHEALLPAPTEAHGADRMASTFVAECRLMSTIRHPHIVQFLGVCFLPGSRLPALIMEKLSIDLHNLLENNADIPLSMKHSILLDVSKGLTYLHTRRPAIIHRDLSARNVLLNSAMVAKITDLGNSRIINVRPSQLMTMTKYPGNMWYMPPEAMEDASKYNTSIDVFSFGNLTLFILTQEFPIVKPATFTDPTTGRVSARLEVERRSESFSQVCHKLGKEHPLVGLAEQCLHNLAARRPPITEVLARLDAVEERVQDKYSHLNKLEMVKMHDALQQDHDALLQDHDALLQDHNALHQDRAILQQLHEAELRRIDEAMHLLEIGRKQWKHQEEQERQQQQLTSLEAQLRQLQLQYSDLDSHVSVSDQTYEDSLPSQEENAMIDSNNQDRHYVQFQLSSPPYPIVKNYFQNMHENAVLIDPVQVLQFDSAGGEHVIPEHDITLKVPEGAVPVGQTINLEYGVHLYGPFRLPANMWPISAVLWVCQQEDDVELAKPIQIIMPHFLCPGVDVTQLQFVKASHYTEENKMHFCSSNDKWTFFSKVNHCGYGALDATHCCYYCITAERKLKGSEKFALTFAHPTACSTPDEPLHIFIIASYFLKSCFKAIKYQLHKFSPNMQVIEQYRPLFQFDNDKKDRKLEIEIKYPSNSDDDITVNPSTVNAEEINYTNIDLEEFALMHELGIHPPRIQLTMNRNKVPSKIVVHFSGISGPQKQRIDAEIPLPNVEQFLLHKPQFCLSQPHQLQAPLEPHSRAPKLSDYLDCLPENAKDKTPSERDLHFIATAMKDWRPLSNLMGFSDAEKYDIEHDNKTASRQKMAMFNKWIRKRGSAAATYAELVRIAFQLDDDMLLVEKIIEVAKVNH